MFNIKIVEDRISGYYIIEKEKMPAEHVPC